MNNPELSSSQSKTRFQRFAAWYSRAINNLVPAHWSPNMLTLPRVPLAYIAIGFLSFNWFIAAFIAACLVDVTDFVDGIIARSRNQVTTFGKFFDPIADAHGRWILFFGLWHYAGVGHVSMILAILFRDMAIAFLRQYAASIGTVLAARDSGKLKAVVQWVCTDIMFALLVLYRPDNAITWSINTTLMGISTAISLWSLVEYFSANWVLIYKGFWNIPLDHDI